MSEKRDLNLFFQDIFEAMESINSYAKYFGP